MQRMNQELSKHHKHWEVFSGDGKMLNSHNIVPYP
jgi:hypothetical protein